MCVGVQVLDRMLLYLRVVYSFDYYSTVEYPHEDAMPHRCGIFHARGPLPRGKVVQHDRKLVLSMSSWVVTVKRIPDISDCNLKTD